MKKMLSNWLMLAILLVGLVSCDDNSIDVKEAQMVELTFSLKNETLQKNGASNVLNKDNTTKDGVNPLVYPTCTEEVPSYVEVIIDGENGNQPIVIELNALTDANGNLNQTEVIMLTEGTYTVKSFQVFALNGNVLYTAPAVGSPEELINGLKAVPFDYTLGAFTKNKVQVDVVCWHEYSHKILAWNWFELNYYEIKTLCFFGDVCTKFYEDFGGNGYDLIAAIRVEVYYDGDIVGEGQNYAADNIYIGDEGSPLCVTYLDNLLIDDDLTFSLWYNTPSGEIQLEDHTELVDGIYSEEGNANGFGGDDGIFNFNVGNCGNDAEEANYGAYLNLPKQADFKVEGTLYANDSYINLYLRGFGGTVIPAGFEISDTNGSPLQGWCGSKDENISTGVWYKSNVYSSLSPLNIPVARYSEYNWGALNWLLNNRGSYTPQQIQKAIWFFTDGGGSNQLSSDAATHTNYIPKVGDYALVLFDPIESSPDVRKIQVFVIQVDP